MIALTIVAIAALIALIIIISLAHDSIGEIILTIIFSVIAIICLTVGVLPPTAKDYLQGKVEVTYEEVYQNSILIRTDTIIKYK